jgi:hypothetical protein
VLDDWKTGGLFSSFEHQYWLQFSTTAHVVQVAFNFYITLFQTTGDQRDILIPL